MCLSVSWSPGKEVINSGSTWRYKVTSHETMAGEVLFGLNENHGDITCRVEKENKKYSITSNYITHSFRGILISGYTLDEFASRKKFMNVAETAV